MKKIITITVLIVTAGISKAQVFNEHQSIKEQLKAGTAPGLQFAPAQAVKPVKEDGGHKKEGLVAQIRKGTAPGMKFQTGGGKVSARQATTARAAKTGPLPSEMERPAVVAKPVQAPLVPTQEEAPVEVKQ